MLRSRFSCLPNSLINAGAGGVRRPSPLLLRCQLTKVLCFVTPSLAQYQNVHMISPSFPRSCYGGTYAWRVLGSYTRVYAPETHGVPAPHIRSTRSATGS